MASNETQVLRTAAASLADWIKELPSSSPWREAFTTIRHEIASSIDDEFHVFKNLSRHERDRRVLDALPDDDRLTRAEIAERVIGHRVYAAMIDAALKRLMASADVHRVELEGYRGGPHPRWGFFRNAGLSGPIADLESVFHA